MSLIQEFKTFAMKGNIVDLAVGFIVGIYSYQAWQSDNKYQRKEL